jgi:hypothetical protein
VRKRCREGVRNVWRAKLDSKSVELDDTFQLLEGVFKAPVNHFTVASSPRDDAERSRLTGIAPSSVEIGLGLGCLFCTHIKLVLSFFDTLPSSSTSISIFQDEYFQSNEANCLPILQTHPPCHHTKLLRIHLRIHRDIRTTTRSWAK